MVGALRVEVKSALLVYNKTNLHWQFVWRGVKVGEFDQLAKALYFSVVTSTTLGYGDVTLSESWQLLATFEAMGGLILFGASTAFMLAVMRKLFEDRI